MVPGGGQIEPLPCYDCWQARMAGGRRRTQGGWSCARCATLLAEGCRGSLSEVGKPNFLPGCGMHACYHSDCTHHAAGFTITQAWWTSVGRQSTARSGLHMPDVSQDSCMGGWL